jgi:hypothetical protein
VWAVWTGELRLDGGVIRRSDDPVIFYLTIGLFLLFTAAVLDMTVGFGLLMKLINLNL